MIRSSARLVVVLALCVVPPACPEVGASPVGRLFGTVRDSAGAPIAGASVRVTGPGAVGIYESATDARGTYQFMALPTREMLEVRAASPGRIPVTYIGITVSEDSGTRRDFTLRGADERRVLILHDPRFEYHADGLEGARSVIEASVSALRVSDRTRGAARRLTIALADRPNAVLAIGSAPARLARRFIKDIPVVYAMVADPVGDDLSTINMCGIPLNGGFEDQMLALARMKPGARRLLAVYDPRGLDHVVGDLRRAATAHGLTLRTAPARDPRQVAAALRSLGPDSVDAVYYLVDPALHAAGDFGEIRRFAASRDIAIVVPDPSLLEEGGTFSYGPGFREMGAYAGRLVNHLLSGAAEPSDIGVVFPPLRTLTLNLREAQRLGLQIPESESGR